MKTKARLILTFQCHRNCKMCVNKYKSLMHHRKTINSFYDLSQYHEIILTGGEPMLHPEKVLSFVENIRNNLPNCEKIYLYTTLYSQLLEKIIPLIDGIHFTIHAEATQEDIFHFQRFQEMIHRQPDRSYRLYVEPNILHGIFLVPKLWKRIEIKPPLPDGECSLPEHEDLLVWKGDQKVEGSSPSRPTKRRNQ